MNTDENLKGIFIISKFRNSFDSTIVILKTFQALWINFV